MRKEDGTWDLRMPEAVLGMFPERKGYWFKVGREQARLIVAALARAYRIRKPKVDEVTPRDANGWYHPRTQTISIHGRAHLKTVFHEFYHHLDEVTDGEYDSSDWPDRRLSPMGVRTTSVSLAWQYAEKMFDLLRLKLTQATTRRAPEVVITPGARERFQLGMYRAMRREAEEDGNEGAEMYFSALERIHQMREEAVNYLQRRYGRDYKKLTKATQEELVKLYVSNGPNGFMGVDMKKSESKIKLAMAKVERPSEAKAVVAAATPKVPAAVKAGPKPKGSAAPKASGGAEDSKVITVLAKENPRRPGSIGARTFDLYKTGMTVGEFKKLCAEKKGDKGYLKPDIAKGIISIK